MAREQCELGSDILNSNSISSLASDALVYIRKYLFNDASFVNEAIDRHLRINNKDTFLGSESRVVELTEMDVLDNKLKKTERIKELHGFYGFDDNRIYLIRNKWCIKVMIHEILHACSMTTKFPMLRVKFGDVFEGLTDLYSGYILFKAYENTVNNCWVADSRKHCEVTYKEATQQWLTFCSFLSMEETIRLYFYKSESTWDQVTKEFTASIQKTIPDFTNPFMTTGKNCFTVITNGLIAGFADLYFDTIQNQVPFDFYHLEEIYQT